MVTASDSGGLSIAIKPLNPRHGFLHRATNTPWRVWKFYGLVAILLKSEALYVMFSCYINEMTALSKATRTELARQCLVYMMVFKPICAIVNDRLGWFLTKLSCLFWMLLGSGFSKNSMDSFASVGVWDSWEIQMTILIVTEGTIVLCSIGLFLIGYLEMFAEWYTRWIVVAIGICLANSAACAEGLVCKSCQSSRRFSQTQYIAMRNALGALYGLSNVLCATYSVTWINSVVNKYMFLMPLVLVSNSIGIIYMIIDQSDTLRILNKEKPRTYPFDEGESPWFFYMALEVGLCSCSILWVLRLAWVPLYESKKRDAPGYALLLLLTSQIIKLITSALVALFANFQALIFLSYGIYAIWFFVYFLVRIKMMEFAAFENFWSYMAMHASWLSGIQIATIFGNTACAIVAPSGFETIFMCLGASIFQGLSEANGDVILDRMEWTHLLAWGVIHVVVLAYLLYRIDRYKKAAVKNLHDIYDAEAPLDYGYWELVDPACISGGATASYTFRRFFARQRR
ncbi:hypothetical protein BdWA1_000458 [Babesia duncani]|uniref:Uncharacterized protein n=1 Tax=Babesia duncani TaxID=323732 RepID=A0AAD9PN93_9APIC|nr:hypothetical protein BdWA1_000458 [Babesia duncani]